MWFNILKRKRRNNPSRRKRRMINWNLDQWKNHKVKKITGAFKRGIISQEEYDAQIKEITSNEEE